MLDHASDPSKAFCITPDRELQPHTMAVGMQIITDPGERNGSLV